MKSKKSKALLAFVLLLIAGAVATERWVSQRRGIASVIGPVGTAVPQKFFDLSDLPEAEYEVAYKTALVAGVEVARTGNSLAISWGHFLTRNESGGKVYACERYPTFEMELRAEGVAVSGEVPAIWVKGPCLSSDDGKKILPLNLSLNALSAELPKKGAFQEALIGTSGPTGEAIAVRSENVVGSPLPRYWNVVNVRLSNSTESLSVSGYEIISLLDQALTLDFAVSQ